MKKWKGITENRVNMGAFDFDVVVLFGFHENL